MSLLLRFFILICVCMFGLSARSEKLPTCLTKYEFSSSEQYISYKTYFKDYLDRLNKSFKLRGRFPQNINSGTDVEFKLYKDGSVSDFSIVYSSADASDMFVWWFSPITKYKTGKVGTKMDDYVVEVIKNTPTKPFLEGMDYDVLDVRVQMGSLIFGEDISASMCSVGSYNYITKIKAPPRFCIYVYRDSGKLYK